MEPSDDAPAALLREPAEEYTADTVAGEEWSEIELALGLYPEWEEEP